jgi:hypothetical protein
MLATVDSGLYITISFLGLQVIEWVKIGYFSIKAWATCRSESSNEGISRRATRTIGAG